MTLRLGGDGAITGCTSLEEPTISISGLTMTTPIEATSGTAAAPSYTFSGDTDNGLYYAGTNSIGLATAGTNAILIDSSGKVGIGTTAPQEVLDVNGRGRFQGSASSATSGSGLELAYVSGSTTGQILTYNRSTSAYLGTSIIGNPLTFSIGGSEAARIDTSSRLLVGTSSALSNVKIDSNLGSPLFQVSGSTYQTGAISLTRTTNSSPYLYLNSGSSGNNATGSLARIMFNGFDGTNYVSAASLAADVDGTPGSNDMPGRLVFSTTADGASSPTERLRIDSSGNVGIGTSSPSAKLDVSGVIRSSGSTGKYTNLVVDSSGSYIDASHFTQFRTNGASSLVNAMRIDSSGNVGIGTTSPWSDARLTVDNGGGGDVAIVLSRSATGQNDVALVNTGGDFKVMSGGGASTVSGLTERLRIDSSGRLLVGTSSTSEALTVALQGDSTNPTYAAKLALSRGETASSIGADELLGRINFTDSAQITYARIDGVADASAGSGDYPGRLVFSTTADGAASPTERMRITSNGDILLGKSTTGNDETGVAWNNPTSTSAYLVATNNSTSSSARVVIVNRQASDGNLIDFRQANTLEGAISVSGSTVTYGGGHLARWSQLPNEEDPSNLLKGTVLSNLDEMCKWGEEDNEQLNKTKVSDVEGDPNVAGVFVATSFDEEGPLDFFCAMTGDMIIRIAAGTPVHKGQLLMSAGDGTAKPQDDDIVRSKTIAKVTSSHVTCTYDDGSYCVPCVLMAC